jgi:prophage maintenance system killer protein
MFCALNGRGLEIRADEAVDTMQAIAAGDLNEMSASQWLSPRLSFPADPTG